METLIVLIIVGLALFFVGRNLYRQFTGKGGCAGGCSCTPQVKHHCGQSDPFQSNNFRR